MGPTSVTIYHNPDCSTSRRVLDRLLASKCLVTVIDYMSRPLDGVEIRAILGVLQMSPRDLLRSHEPLFEEMRLGRPELGADYLIQVLAENPILMNRPIVVSSLGARLCRPPELVLEVLPDTLGDLTASSPQPNL